MWAEFCRREKELFRLTNAKKVVLWGYGYSGFFIEHLFHRTNRAIEYIVDDSPSAHCKLKIDRSFIIRNLDSDTHVILLTFKRDDNVIAFLEECGYKEGTSFIFVRDIFYEEEMEALRKLSYYDWLEYWYRVDIQAMRSLQDLSVPNMDSLYYSSGIDYALMDVCDKFVFNVDVDAVFDFGCGKGGALLLFMKAGIAMCGGVEYDRELYRIACNNYRKLGIKAELICANASDIKEEIDKYNYFYMYNPFQGQTFENVIKNMEESYKRRKREMTFIYNGPHCHEAVIKNNVFKLSKEIYTDSAVRYIHVYTVANEYR